MEKSNNPALPFVAILIVNWNKKKDLLNLLKALQSLDYDRYEIIVVDNASTDGSVETIKEEYSEITVIQNEKNLGGTGGFNTGLHYILKEATGRFDYIWLLDNDAMVDSSALKELVKVAESDPKIGIAGSKIMNSDRPDFIVELGGNIDWKKGDYYPFLKNTRDKKELKDYYDVDYVATCSALARIEALKNVGVMDDRYFVSWDDIDWGVTFKRNGYRVVAVNRSIIFHPAYSEKQIRSLAIVYYACRNRLLMFSKHARNFYSLLSLFHRVRRVTKKTFLFWITGKPEIAKLYMLSISDFVRNKWGRYDHQIDLPDENKVYIENISQHKRFIIIPPGNKSLTMKVIQQIREQVENPHICLLITKDRMRLFSDVNVDEIKVLDSSKKLGYLKTLMTLLREGFDLAVVPPEGASGTFSYLYYAVKNVCVFDEDEILFNQSRNQLWKLCFSSFLGEVTSLAIFPIILLLSIRYKVRIVQKI